MKKLLLLLPLLIATNAYASPEVITCKLNNVNNAVRFFKINKDAGEVTVVDDVYGKFQTGYVFTTHYFHLFDTRTFSGTVKFDGDKISLVRTQGDYSMVIDNMSVLHYHQVTQASEETPYTPAGTVLDIDGVCSKIR